MLRGIVQASSPVGKALLLLRCTLILVPWLAHLLVADLLLSALLPVSKVLPDLCYNVASAIAEPVWKGIQSIFTGINGANIVVSGLERLPPGESAIVVSNHVEWTDFYMIQELAVHSGMLGRCRWFAKQQLKWVPFLGWGLWAMGMPLVSRKWMVDKKEMDRVFDGPVRRHWPIWLIAYSEATRYSESKRKQAEAWCKENNKPMPQHLLYPRTKGFIASVQQLRHARQVKAVYDVTIAYARKSGRGYVFQQPPTFVQSIMTPKLDQEWRFFVHVERHAIEDLPVDAAGLAHWLESTWVEKGGRLEMLRQDLVKGVSWEPASKGQDAVREDEQIRRGIAASSAMESSTMGGR